MNANNDDHPSAGTVPSPEYRRAGCGMRYEEGELKAGIDFSGARELLEPATDGVLIRDAGQEDAGAIAKLANRAYRGDASRAGWTTEANLLGGQRTDRDMVLEMMDSAYFRLLWEGSTLLGSVQLVPIDETTAEIGMFAVEPSRQGEGIGNRLLKDAETVAHQQLSCEQLRMRVLHQRNDLIAYYHRRGYRETGETAAFPESERFGNPLVDDLWFVVLENPL
ncbi:ribosomal protein S18 acetylase RimI-like enzyme [Halospina denitrificans]|uniref:Ribosomal protein S18 acetylase RimI-like enzyme n=1 Tax=Halospina denitrificans TaxID=332522 RepID=A0A4R7JJ83_9GAMM|nr:GNAT family N-acetyltransferase [Halospina denitrificans]TDT37775.1 ribosomal protein S18 acetylase RimI-like enzyme [Halospina denitrificans]